ncbi:MAG TPA: hypothetical protein VM840_00770, partial [Actinomycetota bacterium]|nr:hypothetical protein [Actinomycetota bacterium]
VELEGEGGSVTTPVGANAFVEVIAPPGFEPPFVRFDEFGAPCRAEVSEAGSQGSLHCPELRTSDGRKVGLRWSWRTVREPAGSGP